MRLEKNGIPTEAKLVQALSHPSIVRLHAHMLVRDRRLDETCNGHIPLKSDELWLILEYCNKGSVQVLTTLCPSAHLPMQTPAEMLCVAQPHASGGIYEEVSNDVLKHFKEDVLDVHLGALQQLASKVSA